MTACAKHWFPRECCRLTFGMLGFQSVAKSLGGEFARGIIGQAERLSDRRSKERIAKRVQDQRQGALGDVMLFMADGQLGDERPDRIEDRVERVAIATQDHPRGECPRALLAEGIETLVDNDPCVGFSGPCALDRVRNALGDLFGN